MELTSLASGSGGNCTLVRAGGACLLVDMGVSLRRLTALLAAERLAPAALDGVLVTHEHADHVSGLAMLAKRFPQTPVYAPRAVAARLCGQAPELEDSLRAVRPGAPFALRGLTVTAFPTPHDAAESVGYRFDCAGGALGVCTDLGRVTDEVRAALGGVDAALIEANHDEELLRHGRYPACLKRRILSERGHLSNAAAGELAVFLARTGARALLLGHLSRENNRPALALAAVSAALEAAGLAGTALQAAPPLGAVHIRPAETEAALCLA